MDTTRGQHIRHIGIVVALILLLFLPRFFLWQNATDHERMSDTLTRDTMELLRAVHDRTIITYLHSDHKYPLLGAYLAVPVAATTFIFERAKGIYLDGAGFSRAFVLDETRLHMWLRFEMILVNLFGIYLLFLALRLSNPGEKSVAWLGVFLASSSFYITIFSIAPRIHSWAFLFSALFLVVLVKYHNQPSFLKLAALFSVCAGAFTISQSGLVLFAVPAILLMKRLRIENLGKFFKEAVASTGLTASIIFVLGYPKFFFIFQNGIPKISDVYHVFLNPIHSQPALGTSGLGVLFENIVGTEFVVTAMSIICIYVFLRFRKNPMQNLDWMVLIPVLAFFVLFGLTSVASGRFILVILPMLYFVFSRTWVVIRGYTPIILKIVLLICAVMQVFIVLRLSVMAARKDTRSATVDYLLSTTNANSTIVGTLDHHSLGIPLHPDSAAYLDAEQIGTTDMLIKQNRYVSNRSRDYRYWDPNKRALSSKELAATNVIVFDELGQKKYWQPILTKYGFHESAKFLSHEPIVTSAIYNGESFGLETLPTLFILERFGPSLYIFSR